MPVSLRLTLIDAFNRGRERRFFAKNAGVFGSIWGTSTSQEEEAEKVVHACLSSILPVTFESGCLNSYFQATRESTIEFVRTVVILFCLLRASIAIGKFLVPSEEKPSPTMQLSASDRSLVFRIRQGDEDAATLLYHRYAFRVFGLVEAKLGAKLRATTDSEDVVQSVFRSVFRGMQAGNYDAPPGETLWSLLAVVAVNKLRRRVEYHSAKCRDSSRVASLEDIEESSLSSESSIEFLELYLRETLDLLRPVDREILSLRMSGFQIHEISGQVGRSLRTVERSLQQSRERLAALLLDEA